MTIVINFEASPLRPPCRPGTRPGPAPAVSPHRQGPSSAPQTPFSPGEEDFEVCPPQNEEGVSGSQGNPGIQRRAFAPSGGEVTMARRGGDGHPSTEEATARHRHASGALQVDVVAVQMEVQSNGLVFAKMRAARCIWQQVLLFGARLSLSATVCSAWY